MKKNKLNKIIAIFIIELFILLPIALVDALTITNIRVEEITQTSAIVKWESSEPAEGRVNFGNTTTALQTASSQNFVKNHSIKLSNLKEDQQYYFEVISKNDTSTIIDNNSGNFYTFTTIPIGPLFINASIPLLYNKKTIDIIGKSIRLAIIDMFVNNAPPRSLSADNNGNFLFANVELNEGNNTIRFKAQKLESFEKTYHIKTDTISPVLKINEIPNVVGEKVIINGTVSEEVKVYFYVTSAEEDTIPPPKITNLTNTSVEANIIEFSWKKINISDFGKYIIYRNNKAIALITSIDYTDYSDAFVNSNQTYAYQVAAMDQKGNLGEKSDLLIVKTLSRGVKNRPELPEVDILEGIGGLKKAINTSSNFREELDMGKDDGFYTIKIEATDEVGNKWAYQKDVLLDTKPPEIKIISPKSNAQIYENYADMVTIKGKTEPGARVYLYVKRTPLGMFNKSIDVSGLADEIQKIDESNLRADCQFVIYGKEYCSTHADFETIADANGYFEFENIDLTSMWAGAARITEYPTGEPYYNLADQKSLKDSMESNLIFIAVDNANKKGITQVNYEIVNCWTEDLTWDANPMPQYQSPSFINLERLKEGTEAIYFYFNLTYHGKGREGKVTNIEIAKACGKNYLEEQKRFNYSCSILQSCTKKLSPKGQAAYIACPLRRLEGIEKWRENDWNSFIDSIRKEMTFPFKLTLSYDEELENKTIERGKTQIICTEVSYVVDATYINPRDVLPDWLLYDFVDFLNKSINTLNEWMLKIRKILEWVAIGCIIGFFTKFVVQIYRRITCHYDRFFKNLKRITGTDSSTQQEDECKQCIEQYEKNKEKILAKFNKNQDVQNDLSDTCLKKCYPSCANAWESESTLYKTYRWACDRTFGHKTPSRWTEDKTDVELFQKLSQGSGCANDQSVRGRPLRAIKCRDVEEKYRIKGAFGMDDKCVEIITHSNLGGSETLFHIDDKYPEGENVYKISKKGGPAPTIEYEYVIKQNEDNYLTYLEQTCEQMCNGELTGKRVRVGELKTAKGETVKVGENIGKDLKSKKLSEEKEETEVEGKKIKVKEVMLSGCLTANQCVSYRSRENDKIKLEDKDEYIDVKTALPMGYTSDCFKPEFVSNNPDERVECCCINSKTGAMPEFYQPGDVENEDGTFTSQDYQNMKWSYRYWKINYKRKRYNENRYIKGRDYAACFGQNNWLYDGFSTEGIGNLLIIDPLKEHISAFQCIAISQILNRLILLKNIMVALQNCLLTIRITGRADAGVCKELFSQYICAFIWKIITWIMGGCLPFGSGIDFTKSENAVLEAVSVGMKGVWDSVQDTQQELASEYGNAKLNELIGMGEEDVFRKVCLAAFGYDWEIDLENLVDVAYNAPYATLVHAVLRSREYLTFDPTNAQAKYEYRSSWIINPGCDLDNYEVYLACVTRRDMYSHSDINCQKQKDPYGKNCDCLELPPEKAPSPLFFYSSRGKIRQNQLINIDSSQIKDRIKTSKYRYDHLMFKLNVDRNIIKNKGDPTKCFPTGHADGIFYFPITDYTAREIAGCVLDAISGIFSCEQGASFFYEQGTAQITEIMLDKNQPITNILNQEQLKKAAQYFADSNEPIIATIKYTKDDRKECLIVRLLDKNMNILSTKRQLGAIELPKAQLSGEVKTGTIYQVSQNDLVGGSSSGVEITYTNENVKAKPGNIGYYVVKKPSRSATGILIFIDHDNDGRIVTSAQSGDKYDYNGQVGYIKDTCTSAGCGHIRLENADAEIKVNYVLETNTPGKTPKEFKFDIRAYGTEQIYGTQEPRLYLHIDIRPPITADGSCQDVSGQAYDDEVIVSNGIYQRVDIPIYVMPGARGTEGCEQRYSREEIRTPEGKYEEKICACGDSKTKDCPRANDLNNANDDYKFCYGICRKYFRCEFNVQSNQPCVCNPTTLATKFDCGGIKDNNNDAYGFGIEPSRVGWYCYTKDSKTECREKYEVTIPTIPTKVEIKSFRIDNKLPVPNLNLVFNKKVPIDVVITGADSAYLDVMGRERIPLTKENGSNVWKAEWTPNILGEVELTVIAGDKKESRTVVVTEE